MIGKKFLNKHNNKIIEIVDTHMTDTGEFYWKGEPVDNAGGWSFYTEDEFKLHWYEITPNHHLYKSQFPEEEWDIDTPLTPEDFGDRPTGEEE